MSLLSSIQAECAAHLAAQSFFSTTPAIPILTERLKDISSQIDTALGSLGLCVLVSTPLAQKVNNNTKGLLFEEVNVVVRVFENPTLNSLRYPSDEKIPASDVAEAVAWHLKGFKAGGQGGALVLQNIVIGDDPDALAYDVTLKLSAGRLNAPTRT